MHPIRQTLCRNPLYSTKTPYDIISDSKFGGGGVYCASLWLLTGCELVPNYINKRHAALLLFLWRGYGSILLP